MEDFVAYVLYRGALDTVLSAFDCTVCMMLMLDGLAQPQGIE